MTKETVLVASPSAIGRTPDANGSRVPACPARLALKDRLITPTACVEVIPTGLSRTSQPCTSRRSRLRCGSLLELSASTASTLIVCPALQVPSHGRCSEQLLYPLHLIEAFIDRKADIGREFQVDAGSNFPAQEAPVAVERSEHVLHIPAAKRHHIDGCKPQIRRHAHLGNRNDVPFNDWIMHLATREQVGKDMTHKLAHTQLALRWPSRGSGLMMARHIRNQRFRTGGPKPARAHPVAIGCEWNLDGEPVTAVRTYRLHRPRGQSVRCTVSTRTQAMTSPAFISW